MFQTVPKICRLARFIVPKIVSKTTNRRLSEKTIPRRLFEKTIPVRSIRETWPKRTSLNEAHFPKHFSFRISKCPTELLAYRLSLRSIDDDRLASIGFSFLIHELPLMKSIVLVLRTPSSPDRWWTCHRFPVRLAFSVASRFRIHWV